MKYRRVEVFLHTLDRPIVHPKTVWLGQKGNLLVAVTMDRKHHMYPLINISRVAADADLSGEENQLGQ